MKLDPRTVIIMIIIGSSLMGAGLLAATRGYLGQARGWSRWAGATLVQAVGWTLVGALRGQVPDLIWVVIGHGLLASSLAIYLTALAEFSDRRVSPCWTHGIVIVQTAVLFSLVVSGQGAGSRTVVVAFCSGILMLRSAHLLLSSREIRLPSRLFTGFLFALCGAMMLARSLYEIIRLTGSGFRSNSAESFANDVTYLVFYVTATFLSFGFVLMVSDSYLASREQTEASLHGYIVQQEQAEVSLQDALRGKEALLQEVHHRVKNNLQLITSLMRLEAGRNKQPETQEVLRQMQSRIRSVVLLNETLYKTGSYSTVNLANYLRQIATHLFGAQNADPAKVRLVLELDPIEVMTREAIPCGLIVNELLTNSLKHAFFDGRSGEVRIGLQRESAGPVRIRVSDSGPGLPEDFAAKPRQSLGFQLVSDLARQLQGTLEVGPGSMFTVTFTAHRDDAEDDSARRAPVR